RPPDPGPVGGRRLPAHRPARVARGRGQLGRRRDRSAARGPCPARGPAGDLRPRRRRTRLGVVPLIERYRDRLPVAPGEPVVTLGEGSTPLLAAPRLSER